MAILDWLYEAALSLLCRLGAMGSALVTWLQVNDWATGWVQSIGSLVAIWATFYVVRRQTRADQEARQLERKLDREEREADRKRRAKSLAYLLLGDILSLEGQLERADPEDGLDTIVFSVPDSLRRAIPDLYVLGEVGDFLLLLCGLLSGNIVQVEEWKRMNPIKPRFHLQLVNLTKERIKVIQVTCTQAKEGLLALIDGKPTPPHSPHHKPANPPADTPTPRG